MLPNQQTIQSQPGLPNPMQNQDQTQNLQQVNNNQVPDEWVGTLRDLLRQCEIEDDWIHQSNQRMIKRLKFYFNDILDIFYDEVENIYREPDWEELKEQGKITDRIINIYRPHAESIIAALTVTPPSILFFPDDADNPDDIDTAEKSTDLGTIIQQHNKSALLFTKLATLFFNAGTVFAYSYYKTDKKFGFYPKVSNQLVNQNTNEQVCPDCGYDFGPGDSPQSINCPDCGYTGQSETEQKTSKVNKEVVTLEERGRMFIDLFDPTNVKVSYYARTQEKIGYLILKFDESTALLNSVFQRPPDKRFQSSTADANSDSWLKQATIYNGQSPQNTSVVKLVWFRPFQFEQVANNDRSNIIPILETHPNGCYIIFVNDEPVEIVDENLDDHWTITFDPKADTIFGVPMGKVLATIQDIRAEATELKLQTMEHAISEVFVEQDLLDWDKYQEAQARPGNVTPVKRTPGEALSQSFFETKTATLSPEVDDVIASLDRDAQFVTADFPQIYGGSTGQSRETAAAYKTGQSAALQRLGTPWKVLSSFWAEVIKKAVAEFAATANYQINSPQQTSNNSFKNLSVDPTTMVGNVGKAEAEQSDQLPVSWEAQKGVITQLIEAKDPTIMAVLTHPQNAELMKKIIGIPHFYIPGVNERNKQEKEIMLLITQEPIIGPMGQLQASIPTDPQDDNNAQAEICKIWLNSSKGMSERISNPKGYQNVVLHWQEHEAKKMQQTMNNNQTPPGISPPTASPLPGVV